MAYNRPIGDIMTINTKNYGDLENVKDDVNVLHDIINRQGSELLTACLAEHIGLTASKFNLSWGDSIRALDSIVSDLREQTLERI